MSPFDRAYATSYSFYSDFGSIYSVGISCSCSVVFEIFNVEKCRDLEIRVRGHSRSLKVVPFDRLPMVSC